jgi:pyruvate kinase
MADLPGPKMRIGQFANEPVELHAGAMFTLTTQEVTGGGHRVSVTFLRLNEVVKPGGHSVFK